MKWFRGIYYRRCFCGNWGWDWWWLGWRGSGRWWSRWRIVGRLIVGGLGYCCNSTTFGLSWLVFFYLVLEAKAALIHGSILRVDWLGFLQLCSMISVVSIGLLALFLDGIIRFRDFVLVEIDWGLRNFFFPAVLRIIWVFIDGGSFSGKKRLGNCSLIFEEWWCGIAIENRCQLHSH